MVTVKLGLRFEGVAKFAHSAGGNTHEKRDVTE